MKVFVMRIFQNILVDQALAIMLVLCAPHDVHARSGQRTQAATLLRSRRLQRAAEGAALPEAHAWWDAPLPDTYAKEEIELAELSNNHRRRRLNLIEGMTVREFLNHFEQPGVADVLGPLRRTVSLILEIRVTIQYFGAVFDILCLLCRRCCHECAED